mmetsp:Transcript_14869/g.47829  ORF Transcript_14869/g.47829 Transcript_14869/m.47829 type:complete len:109 (+) Transcript_14869:691-1017(+)
MSSRSAALALACGRRPRGRRASPSSSRPRLSVTRWRERESLLRSCAQAHLSFIGLVSRRSARELRHLLREAESRGYRSILVSVCGLPGQHRRRSARPLSEPPPSLLPP